MDASLAEDFTLALKDHENYFHQRFLYGTSPFISVLSNLFTE